MSADREGPPEISLRHRPTIKGIFVNSHVKAVRKALGDEGVEELERRLGHPIDYGDTQDVLVRDEVLLIEHALDLLSPSPIAPEERAYEAGCLHFQNFTTTPWARMLFTLFPRNFHYMMKHAPLVAERVFKGVRFHSSERTPTSILLTMEHNDYPLDHFRGLFAEWMSYFGHEGTVVGRDVGEAPGDRYEYLIEWEEIA